MSELADSIRRGLEEAIAHARGEPNKVILIPPKILNVAAIRKKTGMTQEAFAQRFGVSVNTLRHWEQGKRYPEGPARTLLKVIDKEPEAVVRALRVA
jgi:putative transcriptional regulator